MRVSRQSTRFDSDGIVWELSSSACGLESDGPKNLPWAIVCCPRLLPRLFGDCHPVEDTSGRQSLSRIFQARTTGNAACDLLFDSLGLLTIDRRIHR
jgi:hypothetical protein